MTDVTVHAKNLPDDLGVPGFPDHQTTTTVAPEALYEDVTSTHLPSGLLTGLSMDAGAGDVDVGVRVTIWENSSDFGRITGFDETQEQTFRVDRADRGL